MDTAINPLPQPSQLVEFQRPTTQPTELLQALHAVQVGIDHVDKSGWNEAQRYKYASEADFMETVRPLMNEHGLIFIPNLVGEPHMLQYESKGGAMMFLATVMVQYTIMHAPSGQVLAYPSTVPGTGMDTGDKAVYKALTGANKYFLYKLFQIPTGDDAEAKNPRAYSPGRAPGASGGSESRGPRPTAECNMSIAEGMGIYLLESIEFKRTKNGDLYPRYRLQAQRADVTAGQFKEWRAGLALLDVDMSRVDEGSRVPVGKLVVINLTKSGDYWNADKLGPYTKPPANAPAASDEDDIDIADDTPKPALTCGSPIQVELRDGEPKGDWLKFWADDNADKRSAMVWVSKANAHKALGEAPEAFSGLATVTLKSGLRNGTPYLEVINITKGGSN